MLRLEPDNIAFKELRADAATLQGYAMHNANARDVYLTEAAELRGAEHPLDEMRKASQRLIKAMPVKGFVEAMAINLNPKKSLEADEKMSLAFSDIGESYTIHVRRGVAMVTSGADGDASHKMTTRRDVWLEIMSGERSLPGALATADIELEGGRLGIPAVLGFLSMFSD